MPPLPQQEPSTEAYEIEISDQINALRKRKRFEEYADDDERCVFRAKRQRTEAHASTTKTTATATSSSSSVDPCILTTLLAAFVVAISGPIRPTAEKGKRANNDDDDNKGVVNPPPPPSAPRSSFAPPIVVPTTTTTSSSTSDNEKHTPTRNYDISIPIVGGGIVDDKQFHVTKYEHAYELEDSDKKNIISVVGQGFAEEGDDGFSNLDAEVTRKLLKDTKSNKEIGVVKIMCTYKDPTTGKMMEALVGVMLLSSSTCLMVHDKVGESPYTGPKTFKVCNLVQICILSEFRQRGLGFIGITALKQQMIYLKVDFLWWCGTATKYYDKYLYKNLYKKNPKMINCPFNLRPYYEEENRNSFYYMKVTNKFQDLTKWYNEDPDNRYFSFQESNEELRTYHNINSILDEPITHTFKEKLPYDYVSYPAKHIFEIKIKNKTAYKNFKTKLRYGSLEVYGQREDTMGNTHKYAETFPLKTILSGYKLKRQTSRYDGENFVITIHYK